jgi:F0F1-type ATP synthase assembly protein I
MRTSSGGFELALSPALLAMIGFGLDRWLGTTPFITIIAAVMGVAGVVTKMYFTYTHEMDEHEARAPWAKRS